MGKENTMTIYDLNPGDKGSILKYNCDCQETQRMRELGLLENTRFQVIRFAPFGGPVEIRYRGYHLSIGKTMAQLLEIKRNG